MSKSLPLRAHEAAAYAAGRLTQTRRVCKFDPKIVHASYPDGTFETARIFSHSDYSGRIKCPYGAPGDRLALREGARMPLSAVRWHPVITAVRLERVQDISEAEAIKCGIQVPITDDGTLCVPATGPMAMKDAMHNPFAANYAAQFSRDNPRTPWDSNPWVWVIDVEGVKA